MRNQADGMTGFTRGKHGGGTQSQNSQRGSKRDFLEHHSVPVFFERIESLKVPGEQTVTSGSLFT
jgi:hypothetical protein